jgi:hypothetical protein
MGERNHSAYNGRFYILDTLRGLEQAHAVYAHGKNNHVEASSLQHLARFFGKGSAFYFRLIPEVKPIVRAEDLLFGLVLSEYESVVDKKNERDLQDSRQLQLVVYLVIGPVISCLSRRSARKNPESYCISLVWMRDTQPP